MTQLENSSETQLISLEGELSGSAVPNPFSEPLGPGVFWKPKIFLTFLNDKYGDYSIDCRIPFSSPGDQRQHSKVSILRGCREMYKYTHQVVLPENWVSLLVGVEPKDTTKPSVGERSVIITCNK